MTENLKFEGGVLRVKTRCGSWRKLILFVGWLFSDELVLTESALVSTDIFGTRNAS